MAQPEIDVMHRLLEDWARLEEDFDQGPDSIAYLVSERIADRLRMSKDRVSAARDIRNRCAHLDDTLSRREVEECRDVLDEALMRYLSVDGIDRRRAADELAWGEQGRAPRKIRHQFLVDYVALAGDAREYEELPPEIRRLLSTSEFRRCRKIRDQISHPAPPPLLDEVLRARSLVARARDSAAKAAAERAAEQSERKRLLERLSADPSELAHRSTNATHPGFGRTVDRTGEHTVDSTTGRTEGKAARKPSSPINVNRSTSPKQSRRRLSAVARELGRTEDEVVNAAIFLWPRRSWGPNSLLTADLERWLREGLERDSNLGRSSSLPRPAVPAAPKPSKPASTPITPIQAPPRGTANTEPTSSLPVIPMVIGGAFAVALLWPILAFVASTPAVIVWLVGVAGFAVVHVVRWFNE